MENLSSEQTQFEFLAIPQIQKNFAELNIELLRGKTILADSIGLYGLLEEYKDEFENYYLRLYGLELKKRVHDSMGYFYLDFVESSKGRLSSSSNLYHELDPRHTIVGFIIANLYLSTYFNAEKKFSWEELKYEVENGELKDAYQNLFFKEKRSEYSTKEWSEVKKEINTVLNFFDRMRIIEKEETEGEINFIILPSIYRFIELYKNEIENAKTFLADKSISE